MESAQHRLQQIANNVKALGDNVSDSVGSMSMNKKVADLQRDTKDSHDTKQNTTTDFGTKVADLDHWLKTADDKGIGHHALEDQIARERVREGLPAIEVDRLT